MDAAPLAPGTLAVVALPLGNPGDITLRALEVLRSADLVAAEDTRTVGRLLARLGISCPLVSYHDQNEASRVPGLLERLRGGARVALVSEAGTPGISDPGYDLVRAARLAGLPVAPVPGPSALTAFLGASGLPTDAFTFLGFPPNRATRRRALFQSLVTRSETLVFYESPHRVVAALEDALAAFGDREGALAREMTKPHEEFWLAPLSEILAALAARPRVLGEVCWGVRGVRQPPPTMTLEEAIADALAEGLPPRQAARRAAEQCGASTREAYDRLVAAREEGEDPDPGSGRGAPVGRGAP